MTEPHGPDGMRAGNDDREWVVGRLNTAFAEGRLEVAELDERVAAAYAAKTLGELKPLTADLPPAGTVARSTSRPVPQRAAGGEVERGEDWLTARRAVAGMAGVFALNVLIWGIVSATRGEIAYFWPVWILIPVALSVFRMIGVGQGHGGGHGGH